MRGDAAVLNFNDEEVQPRLSKAVQDMPESSMVNPKDYQDKSMAMVPVSPSDADAQAVRTAQLVTLLRTALEPLGRELGVPPFAERGLA